jgi:hypothetical protein
MAPRSRSSAQTLGSVLLQHIEPFITIIDKTHAPEMGHEPPSRQDKGLQILLGNFCRDVYQQVYGVDTASYKFSGVKDTWDRAQNSLARHVDNYSNNPEGLDSDPNTVKLMTFYDVTNARYEFLMELLTEYRDVYKKVVGTDWDYVAPGSTKQAKTTPAEAANRLRAMLASKAAASTVAPSTDAVQ